LALWQAAEQLRERGELAAAGQRYARLAADPGWQAPARLRLGQLALQQGRLAEAAEHVLAGSRADESDPVVLEGLLTLACQTGELETALRLSRHPALVQAPEAAVPQGAGERLLAHAFPADARPHLQRPRGLRGRLHYQLGLAALYAGDADQAEAAFEACLARQPLRGAAHRQLAKLRRARPDKNHADRLRDVIARAGDAHPDAPPLYYALFKEL